MPKAVINHHFFAQPGFPELFDAWTKIFESEEIDPARSLQYLRLVRDGLLASNVIRTPDMNVLESVACRYAREIAVTTSVERVSLDEL